LWAELHNYALTSGSISNLLGVWEPKAASRLGLSRRSSGHRQLASTCSKIIKNLGTSLDFFYERSLRLQRKLFEERDSCYDIRIDFDKKRNVCRKVEKACKAVANTGVTGVNMSWGSVQENTALLNYLAAIEDNQKLCEVGLCLLRPCDLPPELKGSDSFLPLLGASPDGMLISSASGPRLRDSQPPPLLEKWLDYMQVSAHSEVSVVEVKCPASFNQIRSRRGKNYFHYKNSQPQKRVYAHQVPQVMLQMLVTGAKYCNLVSYTPLNGMAIFNIKRDTEYLKRMLDVVSRVYETYLNCGKIPPENMFFKEGFYQEFLEHTKSIALSSEPVMHMDKSIHVQLKYAKEMFWE